MDDAAEESLCRDNDEATLLEQLGAQLEDVRRQSQTREEAWQRDLEIAERVHRSMLPKPVRHPRIQIDVRYVPVEKVGGDYCQVLFPDSTCCYVTMCDVMGHGIGPALLATRVSSEVRRLAVQQMPPACIVDNLNRFVRENFGETELMLTFFAARLDFENETLSYSGAGHPGPLLVRTNSAIEVLSSQNLMIGVDEKCLLDRPEASCHIERGNRLIFFTDGLTETMDASGKLLGIDGVVQMATMTCAGDVSDMADCFLDRVNSFRDGSPNDDLTLMIAELT